MRFKLFHPLSFLLIPAVILSSCADEKSRQYNSWEIYRGGKGSNAYSSLNQINKENVKHLKVAWTLLRPQFEVI